MGKFARKSKKPVVKKTRKELRKEKRKQVKQKKLEYYVNRNKPGKYVLNKSNNVEQEKTTENKSKKQKKPNQKKAEKVTKNDKYVDEILIEREKEKKLQQEMQNQRKIQLKEANKDEDKVIKHLEKQLKLNKRKTKKIPASFAEDGLDYLLEMCDPENVGSIVAAEQQFTDINNEFDEDFALMTGKSDKKPKKISTKKEIQDEITEDQSENENEAFSDKSIDDEEFSDANESFSNEEQNSELEDESEDEPNNKKAKLDKDNSDDEVKSSDSEADPENGTWEDIYGRKRKQDGTIIEANAGKYVPPALRESGTDEKRSEKLLRLSKQLKGLLNRLAESNMHSISTQVEQLYMCNSRNDMNETITRLVFESLISHVLAPERLVLEHVMLLTILHANVGTEVGAHFLQRVVKKLDELYQEDLPVENKGMDNAVCLISQLYNFKVFHSQLIYQILSKLTERFEEKHVECILLILKNVGFTLRKDDALALKQLILELQKKASTADDDNCRVKFMLDILLAIKNNNMSKIPNYDTTYAEHLKKLLKSFIRKGNYVTQLNVTLDDLLKADERGRWWVVGSAWTGTDDTRKSEEPNRVEQPQFQQRLLDLARRQHMNTDARRNIFCVLMSAEDYMDAFEKLLRLGLRQQQEREIVHVLLHCCLQEASFNPFYAVLAQRLCEHERRFQMTVRCAVWDKLRALPDTAAPHLSNLARLLTHLLVHQALPLSTLKVVQFSELDRVTLRFIRQVLLGVLLHPEQDACLAVFHKVSGPKMRVFRESLRLFIHHFLLRNLRAGAVSEQDRATLDARSKLVDRCLSAEARAPRQ